MKFKFIIKELNEGIDINRSKRTVSFNPNHEKLVNTSCDTNPTKNKNFDSYKDVEVWSVFRRNKKGNAYNDGNPLIYALKGEGWTFKTPKDAEEIHNRIKFIVNKFIESTKYNTVVLIPSTKPLNEYLGNIVNECDPKCEVIGNVLRKMFTSEVYRAVTNPNSPFQKVYHNIIDDKLDQLEMYLNKMNKGEESAPFIRHMVEDPKMRNVIDKTLTISNVDYNEKINGKDILIIDDIISRGASIKESIEILKTCYNPKSITVLTLLSRL